MTLTRALIGALLCLAALSCATPSPNPTPEVTMTAQLRALPDHPSLTVVVQTGTEHFGNGLFTLSVQGDGALHLLQRRAGTPHNFTDTLSDDALTAFGATLAEHGFTRPRTSEMPREPGDTPVLLKLRDGDQTLFEANLWEADRYDDPDLDALLKAAEALIIEQVGDGGYP